jgi:ubiquinol-cytochrome c reductase cytochrome c1 subunit
MLKRLLLAAALAVAPLVAFAQEAPTPPHQQWSFDGPFGTYDRAALQRGFQVYKEVCANCHPVTHLYFRDLEGIGYDADQLKAIAATYQVTAGPNKEGQMFKRPGLPADPIPGPFANEQQARAANGGALPPDLSEIVKARDGGPDYVYGIVTTDQVKPPAGADMKLAEGKYYDEYFPGHQISMPPPLSADAVKFADGTPATVPQMAHDVVTFLAWASHPDLEARHRTGFKVVLFLVVAVIVFYAAKRKIWSRIEH